MDQINRKTNQIVKINEIFVGMNGEVNPWHQGSLIAFIRFQGCNCQCSYCDTKQSQKNHGGTVMAIDDIIKQLLNNNFPRKVLITGGEPLFQKEAFFELTKKLWHAGFTIAIETNGTYLLEGYGITSWIVDYKLPGSGAFTKMKEDIFYTLGKSDFVKFVIFNKQDFKYAIAVKNSFQQKGCKAKFAFSPADADVGLSKVIAQWLIDSRVWDVLLNLQLHKIIGTK